MTSTVMGAANQSLL